MTTGAIAAFSLVMFLTDGWNDLTNSKDLLTQATTSILLIATLHHRIFQTQGISLAYSQAATARSTDQATEMTIRARKIEKRFFFALFAFSSVSYLLYFGTSYSSAPSVFPRRGSLRFAMPVPPQGSSAGSS